MTYIILVVILWQASVETPTGREMSIFLHTRKRKKHHGKYCISFPKELDDLLKTIKYLQEKQVEKNMNTFGSKYIHSGHLSMWTTHLSLPPPAAAAANGNNNRWS